MPFALMKTIFKNINYWKIILIKLVLKSLIWFDLVCLHSTIAVSRFDHWTIQSQILSLKVAILFHSFWFSCCTIMQGYPQDTESISIFFLTLMVTMKVIMQGKLIAVAYTLRTYWNQFSLGGIWKQEWKHQMISVRLVSEEVKSITFWSSL